MYKGLLDEFEEIIDDFQELKCNKLDCHPLNEKNYK